jgi:hypothetical protein
MRIQPNALALLSIAFLALSLATSACTPLLASQDVLQSRTEQVEIQTMPPLPTSRTTDTAIIMTPSQTTPPSQMPSPSSTLTSTSTPTDTPTWVPSLTPSPSPSATYAILRGTVLEQANCRYGPGAAYLYKYGLYPGNNLEIIGRNETGTWIVIQAIGGTNPCWVKASLLDIKGEEMGLAPASLPLPQSPYYGPLTGANAQRSGDYVTISWHPLVLRAGDDSLQFPYLVEAWLCQAGEIHFTPIGTWDTILTVQDQAGCTEPSHARVYGVEKHGYTNWVEIPWPQP